MRKDWKQFMMNIVQLKKIFMQQAGCGFHERTATMLQFEVLRFIHSDKLNTINSLSKHLGMSLSSATQITKRLIKQKLVVSEHDADDRRIVHLTLTEEGRNEMDKVENLMCEKMSLVLSKIPQKDMDELLSLQEKILKILQR